MPSSLISASLIVCESVIWEKDNNVPTAIRVVNSFSLAPNLVVHFFTLVYLHAMPMDYMPHMLQVQALDPQSNIAASGPPFQFVYGNRLDFSGPGGFVLSTKFDFVVRIEGVYWVQAFLDGGLLTQVPLILTRKRL